MQEQIEPTIYELLKPNINTIESIIKSNNLKLSSNVNQPLIRLGYHYYNFRTRNDMVQVTKSINSDNKFYFVINPFEPVIANYEDNIGKMANIYFNSKTPYDRGFLKFWEMLYLFNLTQIKNMPQMFVYTSFDKEESYFSKAFANFKDKLDTGQYTVNEMNNDFYTKAKKSPSSHLITGNCKMNITEDLQFQEQLNYNLILAEIISALRLQEKDGHFVLRVFDNFTLVSIKMIYIMSCFYSEIYLYKPFFSRPISSERFIIFKNFSNNSLKDKIIKSLETIYNESIESKKYIYDIFEDLTIDDNYIRSFILINIKLTNPQQVMMNKIINFIKEQNYYGDKYHKHREEQINSNKWWIQMFFPPSKNLYQDNKKTLNKLLESIKQRSILELNQFIKGLL
jgi:hypothetical protein